MSFSDMLTRRAEDKAEEDKKGHGDGDDKGGEDRKEAKPVKQPDAAPQGQIGAPNITQRSTNEHEITIVYADDRKIKAGTIGSFRYDRETARLVSSSSS